MSANDPKRTLLSTIQSESVVLYVVGFLGTVAVLPPIAAPHVIASQSDALPELQVLSEKWLVNTLLQRIADVR